VSYGEERPVCSGHNEDCWQQNRRDDFIIVTVGGDGVIRTP
jgi:outer membrane protein OmpA-like peptidoglycan-associated protein